MTQLTADLRPPWQARADEVRTKRQPDHVRAIRALVFMGASTAFLMTLFLMAIP